MLWKEMLAQNLESTYLSTEMLIDWIQEDDLDWKPAQSNNWMTTRQVLHHLVNSSGPSFNAFIHGEWGIPEDFDYRSINGLSREVVEKLQRVQPRNLRQAGMISGVTPAAVAILAVMLRRRSRERQTADV